MLPRKAAFGLKAPQAIGSPRTRVAEDLGTGQGRRGPTWEAHRRPSVRGHEEFDISVLDDRKRLIRPVAIRATTVAVRNSLVYVPPASLLVCCPRNQ